MKSISKLASVIAGIIVSVIGFVAFIGMIVTLIELNKIDALSIAFKDKDFTMSIIFCVVFMACGAGLLSGKDTAGAKIFTFALAIVVIIVEKFVFEGYIFDYAAFALLYIFEDLSIVADFTDIYPTLLTVSMISTIVGAVCHILSFGSSRD